MRVLLDLTAVAGFFAINFIFVIGTPLAVAALIHQAMM